MLVVCLIVSYAFSAVWAKPYGTDCVRHTTLSAKTSNTLQIHFICEFSILISAHEVLTPEDPRREWRGSVASTGLPADLRPDLRTGGGTAIGKGYDS